MAGFQKFIAIGHLGGDPELKSTSGGKTVATFSLAVGRPGKDAPTDWFRVSAWDKQAETVANFCRKGQLVAVEGRIQLGSYEKDGHKFNTTDLIANQVTFLSPKSGDESKVPVGAGAGSRSAPASDVDGTDDVPF